MLAYALKRTGLAVIITAISLILLISMIQFIPGDPAAVVKSAEERQIVIRNLPDGWLRASIGWWNDEADIARLVGFISG